MKITAFILLLLIGSSIMSIDVNSQEFDVSHPRDFGTKGDNELANIHINIVEVQSENLKIIQGEYYSQLDDLITITIMIRNVNQKPVDGLSFQIFSMYEDRSSSLQLQIDTDGVKDISEDTEDVVTISPTLIEIGHIEGNNMTLINFTIKIAFAGQWKIVGIMHYRDSEYAYRLTDINIDIYDDERLSEFLIFSNIIICIILSILIKTSRRHLQV